MYFTIFTGVESIPPGMSDLGVTISIELSYPMWHEGRRRPEEVSSPDMHEGMLHGDAAWFLTRAYNSTKSMVTGCLPHCLILREQPELLINLLFPTICANTCLRWVPACVEEVQKSFKRGRTEAQHQSNNERDRQRRNDVIFTSTVQLMLGDMVWTKANAFQGKRKMEYRWDEVEYEIGHQVANGLPLYETKDSSGKVKTPP